MKTPQTEAAEKVGPCAIKFQCEQFERETIKLRDALQQIRGARKKLSVRACVAIAAEALK